MAEEETPGVEFDMSFSTNTRINYLLWQCNENTKNEDILAWFNSCKNLYKEAASSMKDDERKVHDDKRKKCESTIKEYQNYIKTYQTGGRRDQPYDPPREAFDALFEWELKLRDKLDKMGLLLRKKDVYENPYM